MSIWTSSISPEEISRLMENTMCAHLGIEVAEIGDDFLSLTMPVDHRTQQHMGILHGGGSVVLAETAGSIAAGLCCKPDQYVVGLDINANHIRAGKPPLVTGTARPFHLGNSTSVWEIKITDTEDKLVCVSRLTMAVLSKTQ